ncbi:MAG: aminopeptidase, partial [Thermomicrobiales bacterium]
MADPRHVKFARTLIEYSLAIQPGDHLLIVAPVLAAPLVREVFRSALRAGAFPDVQIVLDDLDEIRLREGSEAQLAYVPSAKLREVEDYNAHLRISAAANTRARSGIDPARLAIASRALAARQQRFMARAASGELRWSSTLFPTQAHAQDAGMALAEYEDFVYGAM